MRSAHFAVACMKLQLTIYDVIDYGPKPPINFNELEEKEIDRLLQEIAKKKQASKQPE